MRRLEFVEPNFICKVTDSDNKVYENWLFNFASEAELRSHLAEMSYTVVSVDKYDFNTWKTKAKDATDLALAAKNAAGFKYNNALWGDLKQFLFSLSKGKCGYCEQKVTGVYAGDVEHYRPKKKVTGDETHPGYYWLAYDERNYVPVCQNCNGARAKANHFPLEPGSPRAYKPEDVENEKPLLINPLGQDDPSKHFEFIGPEGGNDFGKFRGITPAGEKSREVYHLNRGDLIVARREAYKEITDNKAILETNWEVVSRGLMTQWQLGIKQFTLVIKAVLTAWLKEIKEKELRNAAEKIKAYQEQIEQEKLRQVALEKFIDNDLSMLQS